ncbi:hypothetical protein [Marinobacter salsuginis]|uniref:Uncharacterized protein n=1 Tax=Marinobacter salsuginis TaxID=418719 RepID=A0A5M3Q718_9GAMM|nr:hypothetical protein [Marinobacter salsuginis]GBO90580.1 hypothetical protein MSSD14B_42480 [Marinobacter salsuginis]
MVRSGKARKEKPKVSALTSTKTGLIPELAEKTDAYAQALSDQVQRIRTARAVRHNRPRVYFEEWQDPMIIGIG